MRLSSLFFLMQEGFQNIRRNGLMSLAALGTVTVALTVLGGSLWTAYRVNEIAAQQPQKLNEVDVFLAAEVDRPTALAVQEKIRQQSNVRTVRLVTREEAWAEVQSGQALPDDVKLENPLPDAFRIEVADVSRMEALTQSLRDAALFPEINQVNASNEEMRMMLGFARVVKIIGGVVSIGLFIATLFIVHNTIRLTVFARRREIRIMQLVGATPGFIRAPLLLEGLFHGMVGACIAGGILILCAREVSRFVSQLRSPLINEVPSHLGPLDAVGGLIALGALIGLVGSHLAMRRFLKQI